MRKLKLLSFVLLWLFLAPTSIHAQEAALSAAGDFSTSGGSVSYSIGQLVASTSSGTGGMASPGVQQVYTVEVTLGVDREDILLDLNVVAYPNPTINFLTVRVDDQNESLLASLYNIDGRLLRSVSIENNEAIIPMEDLAEAIYLLEVSRRSKRLKTFRILKK